MDTALDTLSRIKRNVIAIVGAAVGGLTIFILTAYALLIAPSAGLHLQLLSHYFIGYSVSWLGSFVGLLYGSLVGAVVGWTGSVLYGRVESKISTADTRLQDPDKAAPDRHPLKPRRGNKIRPAA